MKILIIDPVGGISGDMLLAGLVHMGCPVDYLKDVLGRLPIDSFSLETSERSVHGIGALHLSFVCKEEQEERTYAAIRDGILSSLPDGIREKATAVFESLAEAEASIHGVAVEEVHFHEVGALDSILDIAGIAAAIEYFKVDAIFCRSIPLGRGMTKSRHGIIPLPAPATVKLLEGRQVRFTDIAFELATPTGAAVVAALAEERTIPSDIAVRAVGYGCGTREIEGWPNLCRTILGEAAPGEPGVRTYLVEADVDDMIPEDAEAALARLFDAGAKDAGLTPKIMKRGRPGFSIQAVCASGHLEGVLSCLLTHTTSIGARYYPVERRVLERTAYRIGTRFGSVGIKESVLPDGSKRFKPEYRDLAKIAEEQGIPVAVVRAEVERAMREYKGEDT
ncbi:MAG TPA: nickel pincer cofactor biosynthesis protein LarC [Deltaproteobacteria bacterium]|nr:nickel pincer cofactor biosynthesis protein LarC [Deltaproteobacteria bacterium]HQI02885.1 nickel pincer cofactor biosynthesis protein LarC [Deltaproteobacteria bacterium]